MRNRIDMLIYRLFYRWIQGYFVRNPKAALVFRDYINHWVKTHIDPP